VRAPGEDHPDVTRAGAFPPLQPPYCSQHPYRLDEASRMPFRLGSMHRFATVAISLARQAVYWLALPVPLTLTGPFLAGAAWSPDGKEIAFVRDHDVWVRTLATGVERQLTFTPQVDEWFLVWRPGSKTEP